MERMTTKNNRSLFVDYVKGIAIFLMLWGHSIQCCYGGSTAFYDDWVFRIIYSFHMPLLTLVSGYLFFVSTKKYQGQNILSKKTMGILKPIVFGSIFVYFTTTAISGIIKNKDFSVLFNGSFFKGFESLWFLWGIFAGTVVMCLINQYSKKWYHHAGGVLIGFVLVAVLPCATENLYIYPYFIIGYYFAKFKEKIMKMEMLKYLSIVVFPIMMLFYDKKHFIYTSGILGKEYSMKEYIMIDLFRWGIGLVGCVFAVTLLQILYKVKFITKLINAVVKMGQNTLQIYVLSVVFLSCYLPTVIQVLKKIPMFNSFYQFSVSHSVVYDLVFTLLITIVFSTILYYLTLFLKKIKLGKFIFGR